MYASENALGRNWMTADCAELTEFSDCARATLKWNDGAYVYFIEDSKEQAVKELNRLGFYAK